MQEVLSAAQILERMGETYAGGKTYCHSGIVKTVLGAGRARRTVAFTTAFVRPDRFRFEFREKDSFTRWHEYRYIIWREGRGVQTWWDAQPGIEKPPSLNRALAGATGVSSSSAHTIPALLLPDEVGGRRLTQMTGLTRLKDAKLGEVECFHIRGKLGDDRMRLWIDKATFLVRRIEERTALTEETTTYEPSINGEITDKMLEFAPPKPK